MRTHILKMDPRFFPAVASRDKPFEIRENDRDYHVNDLLHMREYIKEEDRYTGNSIDAQITYVLKDYQHVSKNYCVLGINVYCVLQGGG